MKNYWVQEYSLIRNDYVTASKFRGGIGGGQRIVTDNEKEAIDKFNRFVESQKEKGMAEYRLVQSWYEGNIYKMKIILHAFVK